MGRPTVVPRAVVYALSTAAIVALLACGTRALRAAQGPPGLPDSPQFYTQHVQPIFAANCYRCHGGMNHRGGLHLDSRTGLLRGGKDGAVIVPGHPEQSLLIKLIRHQGSANDAKSMPPKSKLSDADITTITQWIRAGAIMPAEQ